MDTRVSDLYKQLEFTYDERYKNYAEIDLKEEYKKLKEKREELKREKEKVEIEKGIKIDLVNKNRKEEKNKWKYVRNECLAIKKSGDKCTTRRGKNELLCKYHNGLKEKGSEVKMSLTKQEIKKRKSMSNYKWSRILSRQIKNETKRLYEIHIEEFDLNNQIVNTIKKMNRLNDSVHRERKELISKVRKINEERWIKMFDNEYTEEMSIIDSIGSEIMNMSI